MSPATPNLDIDSVKEFLIKEYGFLSEIMDDTTECEINEVLVQTILYSNKARLDVLIKSDLSLYEDVEMPIIVRRLRGIFVLIDGYHRLALKIQKKDETISCLVVS